MKNNNVHEVTHFLMEILDTTTQFLPVSHSIIPYQILLVVMYHYARDEQLSVKKLFKSGAFSEMGNRYHFKKLIESDWIVLKAHPTDFRLKLIEPSDKLLSAFSKVADKLNVTFSISKVLN